MEKNFTVNVAKSRLSVGYTHNDQKLLDYWEQHKTFDQTNHYLQGQSTQRPFVLLDGPPYANGEAHMGHGLNKLLKDLVVKSRWFMGQSVRYQPGWDCHGLPLELAVEKKQGKLESAVLKKRCKTLAFRSLSKQRKSFKRLGVLGDWEKPYVTLSQSMLEQSWRTMANLVKNNLLEYKQFPVHYCPACASSLAEAELENKLLPKDSLYFKMALKVNTNDENKLNLLPTYALVWTTTPWTLPMNQGLVFNQQFEYELWSNSVEQLVLQNSAENDVQSWLTLHNYQFVENVEGNAFNNTYAVSSLSKKTVPVLHADFVEAGKTGFVHMACAHGAEDYELGQQHGVLPHTYLNNHGVYKNDNDEAFLSTLNNKKYTQVAKDVCSLLQDDLVHYSQSQVEQSVCWRHQCGVYYNATWQVFLELESPQYHLKDKVKEVLVSSSLNNHYQQRLEQMLLGRKHWCLSRQRQWGCPMNLLVHSKTHLVNNDLSYTYLSLLANNEVEQSKLFLAQYPEYYVFKDVVDVWFDSGNVVNEYYHRYGNTHEDGSKSYTVDLVLEGKDQFRGWFQSLLWLSVANQGVMPYGQVLSHGFVLNEKREKFSKSTGNGKVVEYYADLYGADVLHLWTAAQEPEMDAVFSESKLEEMKKYYSRLRLSLRFLTSNVYDYDYDKHTELLEKFKDEKSFDLHRYVLKEMGQLHSQLTVYFEQYQFKKALESVYQFCDKTLSNFYFECVKNTLYLRHVNSQERLMAQTGLYEVLTNLFDVLKVFCPFASEEFYQDFYQGKKGSVLSVSHLAQHAHLYNEYNLHYDWKKLSELRHLVQGSLDPYQKDKTLKSRTEAQVDVFVPLSVVEHFSSLAQYYKLGDLFSVSDVVFVQEDTKESYVVVSDLKTNNLYQKCARCWNYELVTTFKHVCGLCQCDELK